jgi:hypothetical protein
MNRHHDGLQGVRCRVVTSCGSGSGTRVRILEVEEARRWKGKKWFWNNYCRNQGACVIAIIWLGQKVGREQDGLKG